MMSEIVEIKEDQVIMSGRGKIRFIDSNGTQVSLPKNQVKIIRAVPVEITTSDITAPTEQTTMAEAEVAVTEGAQPNSNEEKTVAKAKKKASVKSSAKGVHKHGDAVFNIDSYTKTKTPNGSTSYHNGDEVAQKLHGKTLAEVYDLVASKLGVSDRTLKDKYKHLNPGQQRMNLGNRLRKALRPAKEKKVRAKAKKA